MSIWSKVLIGFIIVAAMVFFYLSARALQTQTSWRRAAASYPPKIETAKKQTETLINGPAPEDSASLRDLQVQLHELLIDRGRVWTQVQPQQALDQQTGALSVLVPSPAPIDLQANMVVYLFEQKDAQNQGAYLGEFTVTGVNGQTVQLLPTADLDPVHMKKISAAMPPWVMYEVLPADEHKIFAGADAAQLQAMLPAESVNEYLRDGKPAQPEDAKENIRVVLRILQDYDSVKDNAALQRLTIPLEEKERLLTKDQKVEVDVDTAEVLVGAGMAEEDGRIYRRELRDYYVLTHEKQHTITDLRLRVAELNQQIKSLAEDNADAAVQEKFMTQEIASAKSELAEVTAERDTIVDYHKRLDARLAELKQSVEQVFQDNQRLAAEYTRMQLEAARQVDALTSVAR